MNRIIGPNIVFSTCVNPVSTDRGRFTRIACITSLSFDSEWTGLYFFVEFELESEFELGRVLPMGESI